EINQSLQMIFRNLIFEPEVVKQRLRAGMVSHHEQQASKCNGEQQHPVLRPAYNLNIAPPQASTQGLFQQTQPITQACAISSLNSPSKPSLVGHPKLKISYGHSRRSPKAFFERERGGVSLPRERILFSEGVISCDRLTNRIHGIRSEYRVRYA